MLPEPESRAICQIADWIHSIPSHLSISFAKCLKKCLSLFPAGINRACKIDGNEKDETGGLEP